MSLPNNMDTSGLQIKKLKRDLHIKEAKENDPAKHLDNSFFPHSFLILPKATLWHNSLLRPDLPYKTGSLQLRK